MKKPLVLLIILNLLASGMILAMPHSAYAADCNTGPATASGYFFTSYTNEERTVDGYAIEHFKINPVYADGREFKLFWSFLNDECAGATVDSYQQLIRLPPGVSSWSIRFVNSFTFVVWDDTSNSRITEYRIIDIPEYFTIRFGGSIDGNSSTYIGTPVKINTNTGSAPVLSATLPTPSGCISMVSTGYLYDPYEHSEYVDGLLRVHLRLKSPYNDGRFGNLGALVGDPNCTMHLKPVLPVSHVLSYVRYYSMRMVSPTHWEMWNDEKDSVMDCTGCEGDIGTDSPFVQWQMSIDGGASTLQTTPQSPTENFKPPCCSSVAFLPGLEGSRLLGTIAPLWPPLVPAAFSDTLNQLALDENNKSISQVYVDGLVNDFYFHKIYAPFSEYMNELVSIGKIKSWEPLAYDWRYSPEYIVSHDVQTTNGTMNMVHEVEQLAQGSKTGKVTLIGHSLGGLVGKVLIRALQDKGEAHLIDNFILVASPQLGTSQAAAGLLHGDREAIPAGLPLPGFIVNPGTAREIGQNFQSAYDLLPSTKYFERVSDPIIKFDPQSSFTLSWRNFFGQCSSNEYCVNSYVNFFGFLTGADVTRSNPGPGDLLTPKVLNPDRLLAAKSFHDQYDSFNYPSSIEVTQIAGWGLPTAKGIKYQNEHFLGFTIPLPGYETIHTREGDETVVYPSAIGSAGKTYFFNLFDYNDESGGSFDHASILNAEPVQVAIKNIIDGHTILNSGFISESKPPVSDLADQLAVSTHSPVLLSVTDAVGHLTGVVSGQDRSSQFLLTKEEIPGSTFTAFGGNQYVYLPTQGSYVFTFTGSGSGPATVDISTLVGDSIQQNQTYSDIPVTSATVGAFATSDSGLQDIHIQLDQNGDGQADAYVAADGGSLSLNELVANLITAINTSSLKDKQKTQLQNKVQNLKSKIEKQIQKQVNLLQKINNQVAKSLAKGNLDMTSASNISTLLDALILQSASVPLDQGVLQQLQSQINDLDAKQSLRASLLAKITKLQNLSTLNKSLDVFIKSVIKKQKSGTLVDSDAQILLNLLEQILNAL